ncbi:MAG: type II toxin-antitoxin system HicA family toxin [Bacteroidales bacterium]
MSIRSPKFTGKILIKKLLAHGFVIMRIRGSHYILKHDDGRQTVIPVHKGEIIGPGLLNKIQKDVEIDFFKKP